jgi:hypothetical protein
VAPRADALMKAILLYMEISSWIRVEMVSVH